MSGHEELAAVPRVVIAVSAHLGDELARAAVRTCPGREGRCSAGPRTTSAWRRSPARAGACRSDRGPPCRGSRRRDWDTTTRCRCALESAPSSRSDSFQVCLRAPRRLPSDRRRTPAVALVERRGHAVAHSATQRQAQPLQSEWGARDMPQLHPYILPEIRRDRPPDWPHAARVFEPRARRRSRSGRPRSGL